MSTEIIKNELLGESYYSIDHPSGLKIFVYPKENYESSYAVFGTRYGSIDVCFRADGQQDFITVPEGIAHFLEHKLFESEELDAFARYAKTGASANAYTSFDRTCYLFTCTGNFKDSFEILLDFVQSPYFTEETVAKEQGIIGQELTMYKDIPEMEVFYNMLRAMYSVHPVRIDIGGTVESISEITAQRLYDCYNTFYNPSNMALAVAGNVTPEAVLEVADRLLKSKEPVTIERRFFPEPPQVCTDYTQQTFNIATPLFSLGYKETYSEPERSLKEIMVTSMLLEIIAGNTSVLYERLLKDELINTEFSAEYFTGYGYAACIFSGESSDPKRVRECINEEIARLRREGITDEQFEVARRKYYGRVITCFNEVDDIANSLIVSHFQKIPLFEEFDLLPGITKSDIEARLEATLREEYSSLSVVI
ncbi:MAG: insulinase family protein [Clostridiales bacterium]|nr:insulinase family protein [Clostridiales bacterium]